MLFRNKFVGEKLLDLQFLEFMTLGDSLALPHSRLFRTCLLVKLISIFQVITNWHSPDENSNNLKRLVKNWASVWVQMASSFVCVLVYIWFLVTPLIKTVWGPVFGIYPQKPTHGMSYYIFRSSRLRL